MKGFFFEAYLHRSLETVYPLSAHSFFAENSSLTESLPQAKKAIRSHRG
jgi:hypothetical protein